MMAFVLQNGESPLFITSQNGHLDVVKTLIEAGADIYQVTKVSTHIPTCASIQLKITKLHHHVGQPGPYNKMKFSTNVAIATTC